MAAVSASLTAPSTGAVIDDSPVQAIVLVLLGIGIFSIQDVIIRWIGDTYPVFQIAFIRGLVAMVPITVMVYFSGGFATLRARHPWLNLLRGGLILFSYTAYYTAMVAMPLAEATAIFFVAPLLVTLFSAVFLGEAVGMRRWSAVLAGFAGVAAILRPDTGLIEPVAILPLLAAVAYAASMIVTRRIGKTQTGASLAFTAMAIFVLFSGLVGALIGDGRFATESHPSIAFLLRAWKMMTAFDAMLILCSGLTVAVGYFCLSQAYRIAPASTIAPFEFAALPLAMMWGMAIWAETPAPSTVFGIALILASSFYLLHRERVRKQPLTTGRAIRIRI